MLYLPRTIYELHKQITQICFVLQMLYVLLELLDLFHYTYNYQEYAG